jgi:hypothetical protein
LPGLEPAGLLLGPAPFHHRWPVPPAHFARYSGSTVTSPGKA